MKPKKLCPDEALALIFAAVIALVTSQSCGSVAGISGVSCAIPVLPETVDSWNPTLSWQTASSIDPIWRNLNVGSGDTVNLPMKLGAEGGWIALRPVFSGPWGERYGIVEGWVSGTGAEAQGFAGSQVTVSLTQSAGAAAIVLMKMGKEHWAGFNLTRFCEEVEERQLTSCTIDETGILEALRNGRFSVTAIAERKKILVEVEMPAGTWFDLKGNLVCRDSNGSESGAETTAGEIVQLELPIGNNLFLGQNGDALLDCSLRISTNGNPEIELLKQSRN